MNDERGEAWIRSASPRDARGAGHVARRFSLVIDLDKTYLSQVERGQRSPTLDTVVRIARGLGTPLADIVKGID